MRIFKAEDCFDVSASCHPIYCPMSSSSDWKKYHVFAYQDLEWKTEGHRNCWRRVLGLWSNWKIYRPELCKSQWTRNGMIGETVESLQCGWNSNQTRNDLTLCGSEHWYTWKNLQETIFGHWTVLYTPPHVPPESAGLTGFQRTWPDSRNVTYRHTVVPPESTGVRWNKIK